MINKRKIIGKKLRFEIFKRDKFTCQYCGAKAPDVVLEVDHVKPVSKGGTNDILNLVSACRGCNSGKSNQELSQSETLEKKRQQLEDMEERRQQLEMMFEWQKELLGVEEQSIDELGNLWHEIVYPYYLTETGKQSLRRLAREYGFEEIVDAFKVASSNYLEYEEDGRPTKESVNFAFRKTKGILGVNRASQKDPFLKDILYIRGILRNRFEGLAPWYLGRAFGLLRRAVDLGIPTESLKEDAIVACNWSSWETQIQEIIWKATGTKDA